MAYGKISKKQLEILEYIKSEILRIGYPPAVREICEAVNLKSTSSVHSHLETLEKNGYIRRDPTKPRAIEIMDDTFNLTRREMVNVPIVGQVAIAGILAKKKFIPESAGTLQTDTVTFGVMTFAVIFIVAALSFFPVHALSTIAEHLSL